MIKSVCHGRVAGRTRETRGKVNNGILIIEHRIHNYIDCERTKTQGKLRAYKHIERNQGKQQQVRSNQTQTGTHELMMTGKPNMGTETQDTGKQSLTVTVLLNAHLNNKLLHLDKNTYRFVYCSRYY